MKKRLIIPTLCIAVLVLSYTNVKAYASQIEQPVAGITTVLDKVNQLEIDINEYKWTTDRINMRKEASTGSDIITTLEERVKVKILKKTSSDKWTQVEYGKYKGFVSSEYLTDTELFTSKDNRWGIELTNDEIDLLAKIIWVEARGESDRGKWAATETILNRMYSIAYPDTLYEVLSQDGQFSSWNLRNTATPEEDIYECIEEVLRNDTNELTMDYIYFSTSPRNNNGTIKIGNHFFCEEE
jgi:N-acetylmuramoyl-L-alanine amidase